MDNKRRIQMSKSLSYHLRHGLHELPFKVENDGFVSINDLLTLKDFKDVTKEDILLEVEINDKKRFSLDSTGTKIRANQGHSLDTGKIIDSTKILTKIEEPQEYCVHGTTRSALPIILQSGLNKMNRTHIHFASKPDAISGFRKSSAAFIYIDMKKAMEDGLEFYRSANDVILCEGPIDPKYFNTSLSSKLNTI